MGRIVTINSRSFDGSLLKSWECEAIERTGSQLLFFGRFDREVVHPHLGRIVPGTLSYEYYWLDRWYNVFRFHEPDGTFRNYYCNINMPPVYQGDVLNYVDLDIDLIVDCLGRYAILDRDEFEANKLHFEYSPDICEMAAAAIDELAGLIKSAEFPFDHCKSAEQNRGSFVLESFET